MTSRSSLWIFILLLSVSMVGHDKLEQEFKSPPNAAKPRVWWHWMNGNITKEGIRLDLEWMHRVGIGGFQNFDASLFAATGGGEAPGLHDAGVEGRLPYATTLADQLGLEEAIAGSPGWSEIGGPWVTPAQAMKKFVWSETRVEGGRPFTGALPKPPTTTGPFQNVPFDGRHCGDDRAAAARRRRSSTQTPPSSPIACRPATCR